EGGGGGGVRRARGKLPRSGCSGRVPGPRRLGQPATAAPAGPCRRGPGGAGLGPCRHGGPSLTPVLTRREPRRRTNDHVILPGSNLRFIYSECKIFISFC